MKRRVLSLAAALSLCLTACAQTGFSGSELLSGGVSRSRDTSLTYNYTDGVSEPPVNYNTFSNAAAGFAFKLLRRSCTEGGSPSLTPANTVQQLSLLASAAKGDTRDEILFALGNELSADSLNECCSYFQSRMQNVGRLYYQQKNNTKDEKQTLTMPRALLINSRTGADVRKPFLQLNADFYDADILRFSFGDSSAAEKLGQQLPGAKPDLREEDGMYSYSSMTLEDAWLTPYEQDTQLLLSEERYMHSDRAQGAVKFTEANPLKAVFIMPDGDFDDYVRTFDSAEYFKLLESVDITQTKRVQLRPFTCGSSTENRADVLKELGVRTLFSEKSDFGGMAHADALTLDGFWENVPALQCSGAGITTDILETAGSSDQSPGSGEADISFDKPFLFILADNESNIPIYLSIVR